MRRLISLLSLVAIVGIAWFASAAPDDLNWPNWRGPANNGVAVGSPPVDWSETSNVRWKVELPGLGSATPVIWGDRIFVLTAIGEKPPEAAPAGERRRGPAVPTDPLEFTLIALDAADGSEVWRRVARSEVPHQGRQPNNTFASASAITDGEFIWAFFGSHGLFCFDFDGNEIWSTDFGDMQTRNGFGEGASPAVHGDRLVLVWDHEGQSWIKGLNKRTGEELWSVERDEPTTWATPYIVDHGGRAQVITAGTNRVRSYDIADGALLWEGPGLTVNAIPTPVHADGVVYMTAGYRGNALLAIDLDRARGTIDDTDAILWRQDRDTPYVPSPLLHDDTLYFFKSNDPILSAVRASTGEAVFGPLRVEGLREVYASPVVTGEHVFVIGRDGGAVVFRHGAEFDVVARNSLDDGFDASPAVVGDSLYLRGRRFLYRIAAD